MKFRFRNRGHPRRAQGSRRIWPHMNLAPTVQVKEEAPKRKEKPQPERKDRARGCCQVGPRLEFHKVEGVNCIKSSREIKEEKY